MVGHAFGRYLTAPSAIFVYPIALRFTVSERSSNRDMGVPAKAVAVQRPEGSSQVLKLQKVLFAKGTLFIIQHRQEMHLLEVGGHPPPAAAVNEERARVARKNIEFCCVVACVDQPSQISNRGVPFQVICRVGERN